MKILIFILIGTSHDDILLWQNCKVYGLVRFRHLHEMRIKIVFGNLSLSFFLIELVIDKCFYSTCEDIGRHSTIYNP